MILRTLSFLMIVLFFTTCSKEDPLVSTLTDIDGNVYKTIQIGNQTWMAENLKVTKLNDGTEMGNFYWYRGNNEWTENSLTAPMFTWPDTSDPYKQHAFMLPEDHYGLLYSYAAVTSGKLAPEGWRIPDYEDFIGLRDYLLESGFGGNIGTTLKSTTGWANGAYGTNDIGFNALPHGIYLFDGKSHCVQEWAIFMGSDVSLNDNHILRMTLAGGPQITFRFGDPRIGGAIRCLKE